MSKIGKILFLISGLSLLILIVARFIIGGWIDYLYLPMAFFVIGFFAALIVDLKHYFEFLTMRTTKHGMNMGTLILAAFVFVTAINYLSVRFDKSWDLTTEKLNSLSEESVKVLGDLKSDVLIKIFYRGEEDRQVRQEIKQALEIYTAASTKIQVQLINAYADTAAAAKYMKAGDKLKVFAVVEDRFVEIDSPYSENQVTSSLIRVSRERSQIIYFLSGHGEKDIDQEDTDGLSELRAALTGSGYTVAKINLLKGDTLDDKSGVLAIVGPQSALLESEVNSIREFMKGGGKLFLAADPGLPHHMALLTKPLGVEFKNNYLINERVQLLNASPAAVLGLDFSRDSEITKSFAMADQFALFMMASEVARAEDANTEWTVTELLNTVPSAYAMANLDQQVDEDSVSRRSFVLGLSVVGELEKNKEFRFVAFGDSDFASNRVIFQGINRDLALNSFAFLIKDEGLINVTPKIPEGTHMTMTRTGQLAAVAGGVSLPLIFIILSGVLWMRRKSL